MTKQELISEVSKRSDLAKKDAELAVKAVFEAISETLEKGDKFQLVGFCTFDVAERAAREARNPRDGSVMKISPTKSVRFKAGGDLRKKVNGKTQAASQWDDYEDSFTNPLFYAQNQKELKK